jgi:molybdopterin synthase catalytic subunit
VRYLTVKDGGQVRLTDERLAHVLAHPEMIDMATLIPKVLMDPERVVRSRTDASALLYYRYIQNTRFGAKWLCVVVKYHRDGAFVLTAYLTDKVKEGDPIWPSE